MSNIVCETCSSNNHLCAPSPHPKQLWEEQWFRLMRRLSSEVTARARKLRKEAARVRSNQTLSNAEKERIVVEQCSALMRPPLRLVEKAALDTFGPIHDSQAGGGTRRYSNHERKFIRKFKPIIARAVKDFKVW